MALLTILQFLNYMCMVKPNIGELKWGKSPFPKGSVNTNGNSTTLLYTGDLKKVHDLVNHIQGQCDGSFEHLYLSPFLLLVPMKELTALLMHQSVSFCGSTLTSQSL